MEDIDLEHPSIQRALHRYPDVDASKLNFPSDALEWSEKELDLFVGSGGFLKPKRRKPPTSPRVPRIPQSDAAGSSGYDVPLSKTAVTTPGYAAVPEQALTAWHDNSFWAPYATYMEDVGEKGLRLHAALNKCERFRNVGLKKGAGMTLNSLKEKFKAGILLREFALEMTAQPPSEILSLMWVSLRLELPCAPFMPMYQLLVPDGSNEPVCKGIFGMLMLDTETMSVLEDQKVYEKVATPLREAFRIRKPTGNEGVPKFPRIYPPRGTPFTPTQLYCTTYTIMPSDCDMYRVIFHPQMVSVCDKVNYKADLPFTKEPAVAIYANLAKPAGVDECFDVRIFIDPASATCRQHRVLYLFSANNSGHMAVFMVYGATPGLLYSEEISCCGAKKFPALETFAMRGIIGNNVDHSLNLKRCVNRTKT